MIQLHVRNHSPRRIPNGSSSNSKTVTTNTIEFNLTHLIIETKTIEFNNYNELESYLHQACNSQYRPTLPLDER